MKQRILLCNCEKTIALDGEKIASALNLSESLPVHNNLCRRDLSVFEDNAQEEGDLLIACTQEAPLFAEIIEEEALNAQAHFVNIRERAGWVQDKVDANAKISALLAEACLEANPPRLLSMKSDGLCLIYGKGQEALEAAQMLSSRLSVTLLLSEAEDVILPSSLDFAIYQGTLKNVSGALGAFNVVVDNYAAMVPSSKTEPAFIMSKNDAKSTCSLILDLSGNAPLITAHEKRDGYFVVHPDDKADLYKAAFELSDMVGEFEKPIYVDYDENLCAHARNEKVGCSKCLDICPAGAISEKGDGVQIDAAICGGCGSCHATCPSGAISYTYPNRENIVERLLTLSQTYHRAGGEKPILMVHDEAFGAPIIDAVARFSKGLPKNVIPFATHSPMVFGHTEMMAAFAAGFSGLVFLCDDKKVDELSGLEKEKAISLALMDGVRLSAPISIVTSNNPDILLDELESLETGSLPLHDFAPNAGKRSLTRLTISKLVENSDVEGPIILPEEAPYGRVVMNEEACTLCMACVSACPANALLDTPETPQLRFVEQACLQCSLCVKTCPEKALSLEARFDWTDDAIRSVILKEEEPFECIRCGKPFATQSTIKRISEQLAGKHSMFASDERAELIKMCGDCRVEAQAESDDSPFSFGNRPKIRTTDDYVESEKQGMNVEDFLIKH